MLLIFSYYYIRCIYVSILCLPGSADLSLVATSGDHLPVVVHQLLTAEQGLSSCAVGA